MGAIQKLTGDGTGKNSISEMDYCLVSQGQAGSVAYSTTLRRKMCDV